MSEPARAEAPSPGFTALFGRVPDARAEAPGRVNVIGEHTDYNGGFVLPAAIPLTTVVELSRTSGHRVRAASAAFPSDDPLEYELGAEAAGRGWLDYVQGVTRALFEAGFELHGFDLRVASRIPLGAGLASSAALEVALLRGLRETFALRVDDVGLARIGQRAENGLVGAPVGIMDQMAASVAVPGEALFLDTRSLAFERIPLPRSLELVVVDSGLRHAHATGEYRTRREECESAARLLGVRELRDVDGADRERLDVLPDPLRRRARHVVTENARVVAAAPALAAGDAAALGALVDASHRSLRDDFEVSTSEIDALVAALRGEPAISGARLTGGGFGGSVIAIATRGEGRSAAERAVAVYCDRTGRAGRVLLPETGRP